MVLKSTRTGSLTTRKSDKDVAAIFVSEEAFMTSLFVLCYDRFAYGVQGADNFLGDREHDPWTFETLAHEIQLEFGVTPLTANVHKVMAGVALQTSDEFFQDVRRFVELCNVLAGDDFDPTTFDPATCAEMAWAMTEVSLFRELPEEYGDEPFSEEIRGYIGAMLRLEGVAKPPNVLRIGLGTAGNDDPLNVWADDPEMYSAAYGVQTEKSEAIKAMQLQNLQQLFQQLQVLNLRHGSTRDVSDRVLRELEQQHQRNQL